MSRTRIYCVICAILLITVINAFLTLPLRAEIKGNKKYVTEKRIEISANQFKVNFTGKTLSLWSSALKKPFLSGLIPGKIENVQSNKVNHTIWGSGEEMLLSESSGNKIKISVFDTLPFVMMQRILTNKTGTEVKISKDLMFEGFVDLDVSADQLKTMSSAGLQPATKAIGGYVYLAVANPATNEGMMCGWLTNERGSGIVLADYQEKKIFLNSRIDYGDLRIPAGRNVETETLLIGYNKDIRVALENYGDALSKQLKVSLLPMPAVYCTWYHANASDEKRIVANTDFASTHLKPYGLSVMQIDDQWQLGFKGDGPRRNFTGVRPDGPYPGGMKHTADYIKAKGFTAGIWYIPFAGTWNDPYWKDKTDLFLKEGNSPDNYFLQTKEASANLFPKGEAPYTAKWGGTSLDLTNPKSQEYVRFIANRFANEWGYKYFKMDGLWTGTGTRIQYVNREYKDDDLGMQIRFNPLITPLEAYAKGLDIIRETVGKDVFILGCSQTQNMRSFGPSMGRVDAMRVGPDNSASARSLLKGPQFSSRLFFLNKRVWYNDPDPVYVRKSFPEDMAKTSVSWTSFTGSLHSSSYQYAELPPERLNILLRSLPSHDLKTVRPVDFLEHDPARVWLLTDDREKVRKDIVGLFNWNTDKAVNVSYLLNKIGLPEAKEYVGFDFWANQFIPPFKDSIAGLLPPGGCKIISLRTVKDHPQVVSTSRHLTQGVMDLKNESWNAEMQILQGSSELVGGDNYELRIVTPGDKNLWTIASVKVNSSKEQLIAKFTREGNCIRVKIPSKFSQDVDWIIQFKRGKSVEKSAIIAVNGLKANASIDQVILEWDKTSPYAYLISRNGNKLGEIALEKFIDKDVVPGRKYTYTIQSRNWDGKWSQPKEISVSIPFKLQVPDAPPLPDIYAADLKPVKAVDLNTDQKNIRIAAPSMIIYPIPEGAKRFVTTVSADVSTPGINQETKLVYSIIGDVMEMGEEPVVISKSAVLNYYKDNIWHFDVELDSRMKQVRLVSEIVKEDGKSSVINWKNTGFIMSFGSVK